MKTINFIIAFLLLTIAANAEEKCIFDQKTQEDTLFKIQQEYKGSKVNLNQKYLELQWENGTIKYQRGGCFHFSESITYTTSNDSSFSRKENLFKQVVKMTKEFFRNYVSGTDIEKLLKESKYKYETLDTGNNYEILHENESVISLSILYSQNDKNSIIKVSYYVN